jgi:hypothetical protein
MAAERPHIEIGCLIRIDRIQLQVVEAGRSEHHSTSAPGAGAISAAFTVIANML